jgi:hypothetical protein
MSGPNVCLDLKILALENSKAEIIERIFFKKE